MKGGAGRSPANCPRPVGLDLQGVREKARGGQMTAEEKRGRGDAARPRVTLGVAPGRASCARACATAGLPLSARQKGRKPRLQLDRASFSATVPWVSTCKKGGVLRVGTNRPRRRRGQERHVGPWTARSGRLACHPVPEASRVQFPSGHLPGSVLGGGRQPMSPSLCLSLSPCFSLSDQHLSL